MAHLLLFFSFCTRSKLPSSSFCLFSQGIPMGLSGSVPFLLSGKISYKQQSLLSLVSLPFSLKLLWAPLVDSLHYPPLGRRRSWLLPVQFLAGLLMVWAGTPQRVLRWIGAESSGDADPDVEALTLFFGVLYFLMATQDIAVDGWALTMLSQDNKGMASTCNTVGQTLGYFVSYVGFLALNDPTTCRRFLPASMLPAESDKPGALLDLACFLRFWGWLIIVTTVVVFLFFPEDSSSDSCNSEGAHNLLGKPPGRDEAQSGPRRMPVPAPLHVEAAQSCGPLGAPGEDLHLFTDEILEVTPRQQCLNKPRKARGERIADDGEAAEEGSPGSATSQLRKRRNSTKWEVASGADAEFRQLDEGTCEPEGVLEAYSLLWKLKLIERGVKKEDLALFAPLILPLGIMCPMMVGRFLRGRFPLRIFSYGYIARMAMCFVWAGAVGWTGSLLADGGVGMSSTRWALLYGVMFLITSVYNVCSDLMFVSQMAFFAQVSDPRIGGTYMTFLNTVTNLGVKWPNTLSLLLMDYVSIQDCVTVHREDAALVSATPNNKPRVLADGPEKTAPSHCRTIVDAYFVQIVACAFAGIVWLSLCWKRIEDIQKLPLQAWRVRLARSQRGEGVSNAEMTAVNGPKLRKPSEMEIRLS
ncbi:acetyl-coenzyme a transporter [Cystoisospora suis]|uniref:Acetyl-coenzyme a transporter n=1 Tax=Cystoisospora suis TaxID=483139 RepID=A0A2C6L5J0_9APIC|nr:acetyl-coenzyme a transporter [Cystoisospora suis]